MESHTPEDRESRIELLRNQRLSLDKELDALRRGGENPDEPMLDDPANGSAANFAAPPPRGSRFSIRNIFKTLVLLAVLAALAVVSGPLWNYLHSYESTDDAEIDGHIAPLASRIDGTIAKIYVQDTQTVKAGQLLVEIDPRDQQVAVETARANLAQAQAQVSSALADHQSALSRLRESEATAAKAQRDAARYTSLMGQQVVSRDEYEEKIRLSEVDDATVESDRAAANSAEKTIGSRRAAVKAAQAALDQTKLNLSYTRIFAPVDGVVGKKTVEVGQRVQPGEQLLALVPLDDIWVTADFKETQIRRMRAGQRVTIYVDALDRDFEGFVEGMAGASGEKYSLLPPENATGNYVKVVQRLPIRIRFNRGQDPNHELRPGLSVEPKVWLR
jgi:membrane fusion protein (multidrug efflux system)